MDVTLRPVTGGGAWRPTPRPALRVRGSRRPLDGAPRTLSAGDRWSAWAGALAERYKWGRSAWPGAVSVLRERAAAPSRAMDVRPQLRLVHTLFRPLTLAPALHLALTLVHRAERGRDEPPHSAPHTVGSAVRELIAARVTVPLSSADSHAASPPGTPAAMTPATAWRQESRLLVRQVQMLERVVARWQGRVGDYGVTRYRFETAERIIARYRPREETAGAPWADATVPVPRVTVHPAAAPAVVARADEPSALPPLRPPRYWQEGMPPAALPQADVEGLADQVLRSIDQRVIAARERLGRR